MDGLPLGATLERERVQVDDVDAIPFVGRGRDVRMRVGRDAILLLFYFVREMGSGRAAC